MRRDFSRRSAGFTMVELLVSMGIVIILVAAAGPAISDWVLKNRVDAEVASLRSALAYARSEALSRNMWVTIRENGARDTTAPKSMWNGGWQLFTDQDNDGFLLATAGEEMLRARVTNIEDLSIEWSRDITRLSYGPRGVTNGGSQNTIRYCVADDTDHAFAKGISINAIGRTRIVRGSDVGCTP
ncbi:GspH/FimT family pseudopilin [Kistimonas asteriae]|uniref:GspH/FimT family pseudopilin n=1 Tax=Kistimonas asteriae TaxID=517724 RepID=UPI001BAAE61E